MTCLRSALLALVTLPLFAGAVDVSAWQTAAVGSGDTLSFNLFTSNYTVNAQSFGLSLYPTDVTFALVTAPLAVTGQFTATLTSLDASATAAFAGPLGFTAGYLSSADFQGAVSTLQGHLHLSSALSEDLFDGGSVRLDLHDTGAGLNLGLSPLTFRQDLFLSLAGGPLSVGAITGAVTLEHVAGSQSESGGVLDLGAVPEPGSGLLMAGGGALLCGVSVLLQRFSRRRR